MQGQHAEASVELVPRIDWMQTELIVKVGELAALLEEQAGREM